RRSLAVAGVTAGGVRAGPILAPPSPGAQPLGRPEYRERSKFACLSPGRCARPAPSRITSPPLREAAVGGRLDPGANMAKAAPKGGVMCRTTIGAARAALALAAALVVLVVPAGATGGHVGVGFNASDISGFRPSGKVFLTGGGAYSPETASNADPESGFVHSNGGLPCLQDPGHGPPPGPLPGPGLPRA